MNQGIQRQRGAALVVVLALLAGALIVGASGLQSSLIDERLAGNYRASAQAQMNAEEAVAEALAEGVFASTNWTDLSLPEWFKKDSWGDGWREEVKEVSYGNLEKEKSGNLCNDKDIPGFQTCFYFPLKVTGAHNPGNYVVAVGAVKDKAGKLLASRVILIENKKQVPDIIPGEMGKVFSNYIFCSNKTSKVYGVKGGCSDVLRKNYGYFFNDLSSRGISCDTPPNDLKGKVYKCSEKTIKHLDIKNGTVIFPKGVEIEGSVNLSDVVFASKGEIKFSSEGSDSVIKNSYILNKSKIYTYFKGDLSIDHGYFYAGEEIEIKYGSTSGEFCGSIIAEGEIKMDDSRNFEGCARVC